MCLHPEMPVVSLLRLVHFWVTLAVLVLRRWGCGDQGWVDDRSFTHHQTSLRQVSVDRLEDLTRQFVRFEQVAEFEQGRRIRRALAI